jgi:hypothetical protein
MTNMIRDPELFPAFASVNGATTAGGGQSPDPGTDETDAPKPAPGDEADDGKAPTGEPAQEPAKGQTDGDGDDDPEDAD